MVKQVDKAVKGFAQTRKIRRKESHQTDDHQEFIQPDNDDDVDLESSMTPREHLFLEIYIYSGQKITKHEAAKRAGYKGKTKQALCNAAKKVIQKYESQTDPREIFRRIGLGEQDIAEKLLAIADDGSVAAGTRVQALSIASKCLGLQREVVEGASGARIVIHPAAEPAPPAQTGQGPVGQWSTAPISITK